MTEDPLQFSTEELQDKSVEELKTLLDRSAYLESRYNTEQMGLKILINSLYGALANKWFPLFNEKMAQAITGNGRCFIRMLATSIENTLQNLLERTDPYIISGDTDSVYFTIAPFVNMYKAKNPNCTTDECVDWADSFEQKIIKPSVESCIREFCEKLNAFNPDVIGADREVIADCGVLAAKKKYFLRVLDSEGVRYPVGKPNIKIMGLEAIKSSTPKWAKSYLKEAIPHILDKTEQDLRDWVKGLKDEFITTDLNDLAIIGGVSNLNYQLGNKGVPIGSRAALVHNQYVVHKNKSNTFGLIQPGDKCKRVFLQYPNKFNSNIVAFTNSQFVDELDCVDWDTQFDKGFLNALKLMTACLNYDLDKETASVDEW